MSWSLLKSVRKMLPRKATRRRSFRNLVRRSLLARRLDIESLEDRCLLSGGIAQFQIGSAHLGPYGITAGPDGNVWFTHGRTVSQQNNIGMITPTGDITLYPIPYASGRADNITAGPDGNLWFTDSGTNSIGRVTPTGSFAPPLPIPTPNSVPQAITTGPDGNVWFTEYYGYKVGRITSDGTITEFDAVPANSSPDYITAGPDGNLWFTEVGGNKVGRITPDGIITVFTIPTANSLAAGIALGPDGNFWFMEEATNKIGRITPVGSDEDIQQSIREFTVPASFDTLYSITAGPDGNLWFTGFSATSNKIGRITPDGLLTIYTVPTNNPEIVEITAGPDSNLWFTEYGTNQIGKLYLLSATGTTLTETAGQRFADVVASFHDDQPGMLATNYSVLINWGDGSRVSTGGVSDNGDGTWDIAGSHTYALAGLYTATVTITDTHPGGMTATATTTVQVFGSGSPGGGTSPDGQASFTEVIVSLSSLAGSGLKPGPLRESSPGVLTVGALPAIAVPASATFPQTNDAAAFTAGVLASLAHRFPTAGLAEPMPPLDPAVVDLLAADLFP